jgi:hypothetical protein
VTSVGLSFFLSSSRRACTSRTTACRMRRCCSRAQCRRAVRGMGRCASCQDRLVDPMRRVLARMRACTTRKQSQPHQASSAAPKPRHEQHRLSARTRSACAVPPRRFCPSETPAMAPDGNLTLLDKFGYLRTAVPTVRCHAKPPILGHRHLSGRFVAGARTLQGKPLAAACAPRGTQHVFSGGRPSFVLPSRASHGPRTGRWRPTRPSSWATVGPWVPHTIRTAICCSAMRCGCEWGVGPGRPQQCYALGYLKHGGQRWWPAGGAGAAGTCHVGVGAGARRRARGLTARPPSGLELRT